MENSKMSVFMQRDGKIEEMFKGKVLATRERNYHDDSDFIAIYWDEGKKAIKEFEYATTRFWSYNNEAMRDATEEVQAEAQKYLEDVYFEMLVKENDEQAERVAEGKQVVVVKGRKVKKGTIGVFFWSREENYMGNHVTKIGIRDANNNVFWSYLHNVKVNNPDQYKKTEQELKEIAVKAASKRAWGAHFAMRRGMLYC